MSFNKSNILSNKSLVFTILSILILSILAGFLGFYLTQNTSKNIAKDSDQGSSNLIIYTSSHPLYLFTKELAGDEFEVKNVVPAGSDAHDFSPSLQNRAEIEQSAGFIYMGLEIDPWAEKIAELNPNLKSFQFGSDVKNLLPGQKNQLEETHTEEEAGDNHENEYDPHIWFGLEIVKERSRKLTEFLSNLEPQKSDVLEKRYADFTKKLESTNQNYTTNLAQCKQKTIYTSHKAFGYLGRAYNFETKSVYGISTLDQPTVSEIAQLIELIKTNNIKYVLVEDVISSSVLDQIKQQTGVEFLSLQPIDLINQEQANKSFFELMNQNLEVLKKAMEC